jgi:E3 ubiquitin-protein ligase makorin
MSEGQDGKIRVVSVDTDAANALQGPSIRNHASEGPAQSLPALCKFYARGYCANGLACRFYHPPDPALSQAAPQQDAQPPLARPSAASFVSRRNVVPSKESSQYVDFRDAYSSVFVPRERDELELQNPELWDRDNPRFVTGLAEERERSYAGAASRAAGIDLPRLRKATDESRVSRQQHWEAIAANAPELHTALCRYHADGNCRFGQNCMYVHGSFCSICLKNVLHPKDNTLAARHVEECAADAERRAHIAENANLECGECVPSIVASDQDALVGSSVHGIATGVSV